MYIQRGFLLFCVTGTHLQGCGGAQNRPRGSFVSHLLPATGVTICRIAHTLCHLYMLHKHATDNPDVCMCVNCSAGGSG